MSNLVAAPISTPRSLLERLRRGPDERDWKRFVQLYGPLLVVWSSRLRVPKGETDDLIQDVFLILLRKLPEFAYDPNRRFRNWLWTVLINRANERLRSRRPDDGGPPLPEVPQGTLIQEDAVPEWIERQFHSEVAGRALEVMRAEFEEHVWQACWQTVVMGRDAADVAAELGCALDTVYRCRMRVLRKLRIELGGMID